jgi:hypothetical protein
MVAPGAVVGDVHALFAIAGGSDQGAIHVDNGLLEEGGGLLLPNTDADVVKDVLQPIDLVRVETTAEITGSGWIGNPASVQGIEEDSVIAAELDVLQMSAVAQGVVSDIEDVIGFMVRPTLLQDWEPLVDGVNETDLASQQMHGANAAKGQAAGPIGNFKLNVAGSEHGFGTVTEFLFVESAFNLALASGQALAYGSLHSKPPI